MAFLLTFFGRDASCPYTNGHFSSGQALNPYPSPLWFCFSGCYKVTLKFLTQSREATKKGKENQAKKSLSIALQPGIILKMKLLQD